MSRATRHGSKLLLCSILAIGGLIAAPAGAMAASASSSTTSITQVTGTISGSVAVQLTGGVTVSIPCTRLIPGVSVDTGIQVSAIVTVTNNTNVTLVLSAGGGATVVLHAGESASVSVLGSGTLHIAVQ